MTGLFYESILEKRKNTKYTQSKKTYDQIMIQYASRMLQPKYSSGVFACAVRSPSSKYLLISTKGSNVTISFTDVPDFPVKYLFIHQPGFS